MREIDTEFIIDYFGNIAEKCQYNTETIDGIILTLGLTVCAHMDERDLSKWANQLRRKQ